MRKKRKKYIEISVQGTAKDSRGRDRKPELSHDRQAIKGDAPYFTPKSKSSVYLGVKFLPTAKYNFALNYLFKILRVIRMGVKNKLTHDFWTSPI